MFKRCLLAVIVALLVTSSQIAAAAEDYDWSQAPQIGTKAELARYIENERRKGNTKFRIILTNTHAFGFYTLSDFNNFYVQMLAPCLKPNLWISMDEFNRTAQLTFEMTEFPGIRVANAYLQKDSYDQYWAWNNLDDEEKELFRIAVGIVDEANKRSSEIEKARYIHDAICNRVESFEFIEHATAINALVYKKTDCDGFAESFYMLGLMSGLNVREIYGTAKDGDGQWGNHAWNWITFSDGKSYCIDVTNGFNTKSSIYLWTFERMKNLYSCEWEIIPNLQ